MQASCAACLLNVRMHLGRAPASFCKHTVRGAPSLELAHHCSFSAMPLSGVRTLWLSQFCFLCLSGLTTLQSRLKPPHCAQGGTHHPHKGKALSLDISLGDDFLTLTPKAKANKWENIELKIICTAKEITNKIKGETMEREKKSANCVSDKG